MSVEALRRFLADPARLRREADLDAHRPSEVVAEALAARGHL